MVDIHRDIIMDHSTCPRNEGSLKGRHGHARMVNQRTGDEVEVSVRFVAGRLAAIAWRARGSVILRASCSLMSEWARGRAPELLIDGVSTFTQWLQGADNIDPDDFGDATALAGIRKFPARVACASLPWRTLEAAVCDWRQEEPTSPA